MVFNIISQVSEAETVCRVFIHSHVLPAHIRIRWRGFSKHMHVLLLRCEYTNIWFDIAFYRWIQLSNMRVKCKCVNGYKEFHAYIGSVQADVNHLYNFIYTNRKRNDKVVRLWPFSFLSTPHSQLFVFYCIAWFYWILHGLSKWKMASIATKTPFNLFLTLLLFFIGRILRAHYLHHYFIQTLFFHVLIFKWTI